MADAASYLVSDYVTGGVLTLGDASLKKGFPRFAEDPSRQP